MHKNEPSSHSHTHKPARKHAEASITQSTPHPSAISPPRPARPAQHSPRCTLSRAKVVTNSLLPPPSTASPKATKCKKAGLLADRRRAPVAHTGRWGKVASSPAAVSPHTRAHARAAENAPSWRPRRSAEVRPQRLLAASPDRARSSRRRRRLKYG